MIGLAGFKDGGRRSRLERRTSCVRTGLGEGGDLERGTPMKPSLFQQFGALEGSCEGLEKAFTLATHAAVAQGARREWRE